jgi:hypothetical protein
MTEDEKVIEIGKILAAWKPVGDVFARALRPVLFFYCPSNRSSKPLELRVGFSFILKPHL